MEPNGEAPNPSGHTSYSVMPSFRLGKLELILVVCLQIELQLLWGRNVLLFN